MGRVWSSRGAQQGVARCMYAGPWLESNLFVTLPEPLRGLLVPMATIFDVLQTATNSANESMHTDPFAVQKVQKLNFSRG